MHSNSICVLHNFSRLFVWCSRSILTSLFGSLYNMTMNHLNLMNEAIFNQCLFSLLNFIVSFLLWCVSVFFLLLVGAFNETRNRFGDLCVCYAVYLMQALIKLSEFVQFTPSKSSTIQTQHNDFVAAWLCVSVL